MSISSTYMGTDRRSANRRLYRTVKDVACAAIRFGLTNDEAADYVRFRMPNARTTPACISFYRYRFGVLPLQIGGVQ